ncbi:MAG: DUF4815 domain-containing protein [Chitinophagaceae bacterium]
MSQFPPTTKPGFFNNYDARAAKGYSALMFRAGGPLSANELNVLQDNLMAQAREIADGIYNNGDIIDGLTPAMLVGSSAGNFKVDAGKLYIRGRVYTLGETTLTIPTDKKVAVGVRLVVTAVDDIQDPLLKDNAEGWDSYQQPGAMTVRTEVKWGWVADGGEQDEDVTDAEFYRIYDVDRGNIIIKDVSPGIQAIMDAIANYDNTAHGSYVLDGLKVRFARYEAATAEHPNRYVFTVSNGMAHVIGYEVGRSKDTPLEVDIDFDIATAESESENYAPATDGGAYAMSVNRPPLNVITAASGLIKITETVTKGSTGGQDELNLPGVEYVISVKKGPTTYQTPRDYSLVDGHIDWSASGVGAIEPAPGDEYEVIYANRENLLTNGRGNIASYNATTINLTGLVKHTNETPSVVYISYSYKLQRVDAITMDRGGDFHRLKGRPSRINPSAPSIPQTHVKLALIVYNWFEDPFVRDVRTYAVTFEEQAKVQAQIDTLSDLIATVRLNADMTAREPADRRGQFVDAFRDNESRDANLTNTMSIVDGLLVLPMTADANPPNLFAESLRHHLLPFTTEIIVEQPKYTGCIRINPYQAFEPIPAKVVISPSSDSWTQPSSTWNTLLVSNFVKAVKDKNQNSTPATNFLEVPSSQERQTVRLGISIRPQPISFAIEGFGPGEVLRELRFDNIRYNNAIAGLLPFTVSGPANASGKITGSFNIPSGILQGQKLVEFFGDSSYGSCTFIADNYLTWKEKVKVNGKTKTIIRTVKADPVAETFTLDEDCYITAVSLKFCKIGDASKPVYVQIREVNTGFPTEEVIGEGIFYLSNLTLDGQGNPVNAWTDITLQYPTFIAAGITYAIVVMTNDANHSVAYAQLGSYMTPALNNGVGGFVTGQPYQTGQMFTSSNGQSWVTHPDQDLTFRLIRAKFTAGQSVINLGVINAVNISDILTKATVLRPSADCEVRFRFTPDSISDVYEAREDTPLALPLRISGAIKVEAILTADNVNNEYLSPLLYDRPLVATGNISDNGVYIGDPFNARDLINLTNTFTVVVVFEYMKKPGVTVGVKMHSHVLASGVPQFSGGNPVTEWIDCELRLERALEDGWYEAEYRFPPGVTGYAVAPNYVTRVQLACAGTPANRVFVRNLRATSRV